MDLETYSSRQRAISRQVVALALRLLNPLRLPALNLKQWNDLIKVLFVIVESGRYDSAALGRQFFDGEWERFNTEPPPDIFLDPYRIEWFKDSLEPVREQFMQADAPASAITAIANVAMKETENGARRTIIRAVEDRPMVGWARVLTGLENCGFCVMLASRGPDYGSRSAALFKTKKAKTYTGNDHEEFHPGCDCKVVPVFDEENWPGRDSFLEAEQMWEDATKNGRRGKDALNHLRRTLYAQQKDETGSQPAAA